MTRESPLFVSAMELLAHASELYAQKDSLKLKFVILHLANAVELILKACLIEKGSSIYDPKNPKNTLTIWETAKECERLGVSIPEKAKLELLIDDRNQIQHRFGSPSLKTVDFYMSMVLDFMGRFLTDAFCLSLEESMEPHLSPELMALIGLGRDEFQHLNKLAQVSPGGAVLQAVADIESLLERKLRALAGGHSHPLYQHPHFPAFLDGMIEQGYVPKDFPTKFRELRLFRNQVAHGRKTTAGSAEALATAKTFLLGLTRSDKEGTLTRLWPPTSDISI